MEGAQLLDADRRDRLRRAFAGMGIGVFAVELGEQLQAGQLAGVLLLEFEAGQQLVLDPLQRVLGEARLADHLAEQFQRRLALVGGAQAAQAGHRHVAVGAVAEVRAEAFEATGDGADVLAFDTLVEHGVGQQRQPGYVAVLAAAGGEGQAQVEHRQFAGLDEQHLGAFGGLPALDVQAAPRQRLVAQLGQRLQARLPGPFGRYGGLAGFAGHVLLDRLAGLRQDAGAIIAARQAETDRQQQAEQAMAQGFGFTHHGLPRAEHGRRSGACG
ncbi:hypothetical protein BAY1663_00806 [Pseudomonas sp. BAY1663]|nr:hypothetical protein BAY1663_00806 [Pseudomonas sp. BAY1663]